jgi:hypothetical protein
MIKDSSKFQLYALDSFMQYLGYRRPIGVYLYYKEDVNPVSFNKAVRLFNTNCIKTGRYSSRSKYTTLKGSINENNVLRALDTKACEKVYLKYSKRKKVVKCERHKIKFRAGYNAEDLDLL